MTRPEPDFIEIEPSDGEDYAKIEIPEGLALRAWTLGAVEGKPRTLGDIVEAQARTDVFTTRNAGPEEMLVTDESRHRVELEARTVNTYCFLDALLLAFLEDDEIRVTTTPPRSDTPIELSASPDRIQAPAEEFVVSFGVSADVPTDPAALEDKSEAELLELGHRYGCPKINLFEDETAYQAWGSQADAITIPMRLPEALALARDIVRAWGQTEYPVSKIRSDAPNASDRST